MSPRMTALAGLLAISLAACGDDEVAPPPTTTSVAAAPEVAAAPTADEVPVPEDFSDRAQTEVTTENYRAQLDAVEGELAAPQ